MLDGFELPAGAWERAVLPARMDRYDPSMLDMLCLSGEVGWARLTPPGVMKLAPVHAGRPVPPRTRRRVAGAAHASITPGRPRSLDDDAGRAASGCATRGASFFR